MVLYYCVYAIWFINDVDLIGVYFCEISMTKSYTPILYGHIRAIKWISSQKIANMVMSYTIVRCPHRCSMCDRISCSINVMSEYTFYGKFFFCSKSNRWIVDVEMFVKQKPVLNIKLAWILVGIFTLNNHEKNDSKNRSLSLCVLSVVFR